MAWYKTYTAMRNFGIYAGLTFNRGTVDNRWNFLHYENDDLTRMLTLDAQYAENPDYIGGVPGSGKELSELEVRNISTDPDNPTDLFAILVYGDPDAERVCIAVKAYRSSVYSWATYGSTVDVDSLIYKRVYTDPNTFTDTLLARVGCRVVLMPCHAHLEFFQYGETWVCGMSSYFPDSGDNPKSLWHLWCPTKAAFLQEFHDKTPDGKERSDQYGPESEPGGYGPGSGEGGGSGGPAPTFNDTSDPWNPSGMPPGISALGFLNIYKCGANALANLGAEMYPEIQFPTSLQDVGPVIAAISDSIWNSRLIDFIVSIHLIPAAVPTTGSDVDIKLGVRTMTGIRAQKVTADYVDINLGNLKIEEYYTSFADYMTRCRLFLPFYGYVDIKPEYWQSATLNVKYRFNVVDGSFVATVTSTIARHQKQCQVMVGQYSGSACIHLPATGASYAAMFSGMVSNASGAAVGLATGNVAAAGTSIMNIAKSSSGEMQYSNPYNASASIMGHRTPFLLIERPVSHFSIRYATEKGIPLLVSKTIGECHGFTQAEDIILDGIPCTQAEKEKIRALFKNGVIIR